VLRLKTVSYLIFCQIRYEVLNIFSWLPGETGSEIVARLKRDLLSTMLGAIMYWPICDFITFKFIPVNLQVPV